MTYIPKHTTCRFEEQKREMIRGKEKREMLQRAGNPVTVDVALTWDPKDPDMSVCRACTETIYGRQYQMTVAINGRQIEQSRPVKLCEPCYLQIK